MKTNIKNLPKGQVELEIEITAEEFDKYYNQTLLDLAKNVEIEGFRKGKAPAEMAKQRIGEQKLMVEASETAVRESYLKAIEENKLEPISSPEVEITKLAKGNSFIFRAKFFVMPKIELPDYKKIISKIKKTDVKVEEKEIEESLGWIRKSRAKFTAKNEPAQNGDFVEIDYWISDSEKPAPPQNIKDAFILGDGHLLGDFEKEIVGMKAGEEKDNIIVEMPEEHHQKDVAGKKLKLKIKLVAVQNTELPELNDEFAKSLGKFENVEALKENIRHGLLHEKEHQESYKLRDKILNAIIKETKWDLPEFLAEQEQKRMLEDAKHNIAHSGKMNFEEYLKQVGKTEKEVFDSFKPEAERRVKNYLILKNVEEKEEMIATEEEVKEEMEKMALQYHGQGEDKTEIDKNKIKSYTESTIKQEKTFKLLESFLR